jgi:hypothetical protein
MNALALLALLVGFLPNALERESTGWNICGYSYHAPIVVMQRGLRKEDVDVFGVTENVDHLVGGSSTSAGGILYAEIFSQHHKHCARRYCGRQRFDRRIGDGAFCLDVTIDERGHRRDANVPPMFEIPGIATADILPLRIDVPAEQLLAGTDQFVILTDGLHVDGLAPEIRAGLRHSEQSLLLHFVQLSSHDGSLLMRIVGSDTDSQQTYASRSPKAEGFSNVPAPLAFVAGCLLIMGAVKLLLYAFDGASDSFFGAAFVLGFIPFGTGAALVFFCFFPGSPSIFGFGIGSWHSAWQSFSSYASLQVL